MCSIVPGNGTVLLCVMRKGIAMPGKILIVESPTKARTISRMLGRDYETFASMGHVRDLPERTLGVDIENDFAPVYEDIPRSRKILSDIRTAAKKSTIIYLATDPDREGEAIAWHLQELLSRGFKGEFQRVSFHEITRTAIEKALASGGSINKDLVDAQQARRVLDRVVGYKVSPLLWSQIAKGASAGRVQSVALRLIVEREREINAFVPEEYWNFELDFVTGSGAEFTARLFKIDGSDFKVSDNASAMAICSAVENAGEYKVAVVNRSRKHRNPYPPFTTSTMQQAANRQLRMSATNTMKTAQALYEGVDLGAGGITGLITYMRTDSVNIAAEARAAAREYIASAFGSEYVPATPNIYRSKSMAQEAHEAIRPTEVTRTPESLKDILSGAELKLYTLIWKRFVASQMTPAEFDTLTVDVDTKGTDGHIYSARCTASATIFKGCTVVYSDDEKLTENENRLSRLARVTEGEACTLASVNSQQKFTEPPSRYSEATLIKELEENGVGRPSTYASIIRTIETRRYIAHEKTQLYPTELGIRVTDFLVNTLPGLFNVEFTREMESELDLVEEGKIEWTSMMRSFYGDFSKWLDEAKMHGAPEKDSAARLLELLSKVDFPKESVPAGGRGQKSDASFLASLRKNFETRGNMSSRQYGALCNLAAKYVAVVPELAEYVQPAEKKSDAAQQKSAAVDWSPVFAALDQVVFPAPETKDGKKGFDAAKFCKSFKKQYAAGRNLSVKQLGVLRRIVSDLQEQIQDADKLLALFDDVIPAPPAKNTAAGKVSRTEPTSPDQGWEDLDFLASVTRWDEPVKKGRRVYDDRIFYDSLAKQKAKGKKLSEKQLAALAKLAAKYRDKVTQDVTQ